MGSCATTLYLCYMIGSKMNSLQKERGRTTQPQLKFAGIAHGIDPVSHSRYFHSLAQLARWQAVPMIDIERGGPCASVSAPGTPLLWRPSEPRNRHTCARSCRYPEKPVSGRPLRHSFSDYLASAIWRLVRLHFLTKCGSGTSLQLMWASNPKACQAVASISA